MISKTLFSMLLLLFTVLACTPVSAEGSKELMANGGYRAFLASRSVANFSYPFPTLGTMKVFVKVGETIYAGSSAQGMGSGTIILRSPNGSSYTSGNSTTIGRIASRSQEVAGPQPNAGGYVPLTRTAIAGEEGIWEIDFISQNNGANSNTNPTPILANANWTQPAGEYITAFDVSVRNVANTAFIPGRMYCNIFNGILGSFDVGFNGIFHILTKDGYQYTLDNNGQAGNGFSFFTNNKGFRNSSGSASYKSVDNLQSPNIQDPRTADTPSDITHKVFFNIPATDLPESAKLPNGTSTWLLCSPIIPKINSNSAKGIEGTIGKSGTNPLGSTIEFDANQNGNYVISIDVDNNGVFTDAIDRRLSGVANAGANSVAWDGLDGLGGKVPASRNGQLTVNINIVLFGGEVHFPFFDVERNVNGLKLTRINGSGSPENTLYWDDSPITVIVGTPSNPLVNLTGLNSNINGHKWGSPGAGAVDFGDENGLDTWAYISSLPLVATVTFQLRESDLEVVSISPAQDCTGKQLSYTVVVKNNGPSDVSGAGFRFSYPTGFMGVTTSSTQTSGLSATISEDLGTSAYNSMLDLASGAVRTIVIKGSMGTAPASGILSVSASMIRPADVTDPDATNPDAAPPTDPLVECNSSPSGTGCNNIKNLSTTFTATLDAGPDQTVVQNTPVNLSAKGSGNWTQSGILPSVALIGNPSDPATAVSGLNKPGVYTFIWSNGSGCSDQVDIIVTFSGTVTVPSIFTPNGDGKNDVFEIQGISNFPGSQLLVFNRWGNEVYRSENYLNTWDGSGLSEGTYFYILQQRETADKVTPIKGWVYLKR